MSKQADMVRFAQSHWRWGALPRRAQYDLAKFWLSRKRASLSLKERDDRLNKILHRHGKIDLGIMRLDSPYRDTIRAAQKGVVCSE